MSRRFLRLALLLVTLTPSPVHASELDASTTTLYQAMTLRDVRGFLRDSNRLTQFLHLRAAGRPHDHLVHFVTSLRYDINFAITNGEEQVDPNIRRDRFDILLGYADWRLPSGGLSLRLGRQIDWRAQGVFAFDGLTARVVLPFHLALQASAGLRVRNRAWLGAAALAEELAEESTLAPTYGVSLALAELARASAEIGWRRTFDGSVVEERVHATAWSRPLQGLDLSGLLDVDALLGVIGAARIEVAYRVLDDALDAALAYEMSRPRFAADSIFTVFDLRDRHAGQFWVVLRPARDWQVQGGYEYRRYSGGREWVHAEGDPPERGTADAHVMRASTRWQAGRLDARLGLEAEWGIDGALGLADLSARVLVIEDLLLLRGRAAARLYGGLTSAGLAPAETRAFGFDSAAFTAVLEAEIRLGRFGTFEAGLETTVDEFHDYLIRGVGLLNLEFEL